jgi:hypothetical protein
MAVLKVSHSRTGVNVESFKPHPTSERDDLAKLNQEEEFSINDFDSASAFDLEQFDQLQFDLNRMLSKESSLDGSADEEGLDLVLGGSGLLSRGKTMEGFKSQTKECSKESQRNSEDNSYDDCSSEKGSMKRKAENKKDDLQDTDMESANNSEESSEKSPSESSDNDNDDDTEDDCEITAGNTCRKIATASFAHATTMISILKSSKEQVFQEEERTSTKGFSSGFS